MIPEHRGVEKAMFHDVFELLSVISGPSWSNFTGKKANFGVKKGSKPGLKTRIFKVPQIDRGWSQTVRNGQKRSKNVQKAAQKPKMPPNMVKIDSKWAKAVWDCVLQSTAVRCFCNTQSLKGDLLNLTRSVLTTLWAVGGVALRVQFVFCDRLLFAELNVMTFRVELDGVVRGGSGRAASAH